MGDDEVMCINCGGMKIRVDTYTLTIATAKTETTYFCLDCGYMWKER